MRACRYYRRSTTTAAQYGMPSLTRLALQDKPGTYAVQSWTAPAPVGMPHSKTFSPHHSVCVLYYPRITKWLSSKKYICRARAADATTSDAPAVPSAADEDSSAAAHTCDDSAAPNAETSTHSSASSAVQAPSSRQASSSGRPPRPVSATGAQAPCRSMHTRLTAASVASLDLDAVAGDVAQQRDGSEDSLSIDDDVKVILSRNG